MAGFGCTRSACGSGAQTPVLKFQVSRSARRVGKTAMSVEVFIPYRPQSRAREIIEQANGIIEGYLSQGFKLTLR